MNIGVNIRVLEVQALLLYSVAKEVGAIIVNKRKIAAEYVEACQELGITYIDQEAKHTRGDYYKFIVLAENGNVQRCAAQPEDYDYDVEGIRLLSG